jgi:hypothetical protein
LERGVNALHSRAAVISDESCFSKIISLLAPTHRAATPSGWFECLQRQLAIASEWYGLFVNGVTTVEPGHFRPSA